VRDSTQEEIMIKTLVTTLLVPLVLGATDRAPQRPINLNTASVTELMQLPRIGARTAERILAFRKQHGGFQRPEELMNVKGIGEKRFLQLRPHVLAGRAAASGR
jgi:competence protein ComEA